MNRRGFISALLAAPLIPASLKLDFIAPVVAISPSLALAQAMEKMWRDCIRGHRPDYIICNSAFYDAYAGIENVKGIDPRPNHWWKV